MPHNRFTPSPRLVTFGACLLAVSLPTAAAAHTGPGQGATGTLLFAAFGTLALVSTVAGAVSLMNRTLRRRVAEKTAALRAELAHSREVERSLREREAGLRAIVENTDAILATDRKSTRLNSSHRT